MKIDITKFAETPCKPGLEWLDGLGTLEAEEVIKLGLEQNRHYDLKWGLANLMTKAQRVEWAILSAESVLYIFESKYHDKRLPRVAIDRAKYYLANPSDDAKHTAEFAARAVLFDAYNLRPRTAVRAVARSAGYAARSAAYDDTDDCEYAARLAAFADPYRADDIILKGYEILTGETL